MSAPKLDGFSQQFAAQHPEVGEVDEGANLSSEQAAALGDILDRKIIELSRKPELTFQEMIFLDRTADLGARNIIYVMERNDVQPPVDVARNLIRKADNLADNATTSVRPEEQPEQLTPAVPDMARALGNISGGRIGASIAEKPYVRPNVEDFASAAVTGFADMVSAHEAAGGQVTIDGYLEGNLKNMIAHYEMAQAAEAVAIPAGQLATRQ